MAKSKSRHLRLLGSNDSDAPSSSRFQDEISRRQITRAAGLVTPRRRHAPRHRSLPSPAIAHCRPRGPGTPPRRRRTAGVLHTLHASATGQRVGCRCRPTGQPRAVMLTSRYTLLQQHGPSQNERECARMEFDRLSPWKSTCGRREGSTGATAHIWPRKMGPCCILVLPLGIRNQAAQQWKIIGAYHQQDLVRIEINDVT